MSVAEGGRRSRAGFAVVLVAVVVSDGVGCAGSVAALDFDFDFDFGLVFRGREYFVVMRVVVG